MQHVEFFDKEHFDRNYLRKQAPASLSQFVDFFWQTRFEHLWDRYPEGFSDALFPNTGYTYLLNLGTPFTMQLDDTKIAMRTDGLLPRHAAIECYHQPGNCLFGIKFRVSPILFEKRIDFSEYKHFVYPLSYLADKALVEQSKEAKTFEERVNIWCEYFETVTKRHHNELKPINIVTKILEYCDRENDFNKPVGEYARENGITVRTLQRYFETTTSISTKQAIQILRIRKAAQHIANKPESFHYSQYGYYDHSHFYKHLRKFLRKKTVDSLKPHLELLQKIHKQKKV